MRAKVFWTSRWAINVNAPSSKSKRTVLVAVDEPAIARAWTEGLCANGLEVVWARTGESALALAKAERPDLLLADWMLPGIDGMALCRLVRDDATLRDIPVILALPSPLALPDGTAAVLQTVYLRKPVDAWILCSTISILLPGENEPGNPPTIDSSKTGHEI